MYPSQQILSMGRVQKSIYILLINFFDLQTYFVNKIASSLPKPRSNICSAENMLLSALPNMFFVCAIDTQPQIATKSSFSRDKSSVQYFVDFWFNLKQSYIKNIVCN